MDEVTYHNDNLIEIRDSYSSINHQSVVIVINLERPLFRAFVTKKKDFVHTSMDMWKLYVEKKIRVHILININNTKYDV